MMRLFASESSESRLNPSPIQTLLRNAEHLRDHLAEVQKHIVFPELEHRLTVGSYCDVFDDGALTTLQPKVLIK